MSDINNHVNGVNNPHRPYRLLKDNEDINDPNIRWLERFSTFCQRVGATANWSPEGGLNGATIRVRVTVNRHMLDVIGHGQNLQRAKAQLVKQLVESQHSILHIPLLSQFANPPANGNALANSDPAGPIQVNGDPVQANGDPAQVNDGPAQVNGDLAQVNGV